MYNNRSQSNKIKLLSLSFLSSVLFVLFVFLLSYGTLINLVGTGLKLERQQWEREIGGCGCYNANEKQKASIP